MSEAAHMGSQIGDISWSEVNERRYRTYDLILPLVCLVVCLVWAAFLPVEQAPDEYMRLPIPFYILENGQLPLGTDEAIRNPWWGTSYAFTPYGASLLSVVFLKIFSFFTASEAVLTFAARIPSAIFVALTVLVCEKIGRKVFEAPLAPYCMALFVGFLPQFVFLGSYLNQDGMEVFATALIVYAWLVGIERQWSIPSCLLLGIAIGICALSYYFAYGFMLMSIFVFFATGHRMVKDGRLTRAALLGRALLVTAVAIAVGGWFFIRNFLIYDGDLFGRATSAKMSEQYAIDSLKPSVKTTPRDRGVALKNILTDLGEGSWLGMSARSFVGCFGYMTTYLSPKVYLAYFFVVASTSVASLFHLVRGRAYEGRWAVRLGLLTSALIVFGIAVYYSWAVDYQPQGRYLMGMLVPLALLVGSGFDAVGCGLVYSKNEHSLARRAGTVLLVAFLVAYVALFCFVAFNWIVPEHMGGILLGGSWR